MTDSLSRLIGKTPTDESHLRAMKAAAYHKRQVVCLALDEIKDPIVREVFDSEGARHFGKRTSTTQDVNR